MHQIDATTALKIFVDAALQGTAEPTLKETFIEHDARSERIHIASTSRAPCIEGGSWPGSLERND